MMPSPEMLCLFLFADEAKRSMWENFVSALSSSSCIYPRTRNTNCFNFPHIHLSTVM
jgi:hypothetical protein